MKRPREHVYIPAVAAQITRIKTPSYKEIHPTCQTCDDPRAFRVSTRLSCHAAKYLNGKTPVVSDILSVYSLRRGAEVLPGNTIIRLLPYNDSSQSNLRRHIAVVFCAASIQSTIFAAHTSSLVATWNFEARKHLHHNKLHELNRQHDFRRRAENEELLVIWTMASCHTSLGCPMS
jgi:hypothetical protein